MRELVLRGTTQFARKHQSKAKNGTNKFLPDTDRRVERREDGDEFVTFNEYRDAPEFIHLSEVTITAEAGQTTQPQLWRDGLAAVISWWMD